MEYKLSEEAAQDQVDIIFGYYGFDLDDLEGDAKKAIQQAVRKILKGVRLGHIEISNDDDLKIVQHLQRPPGDIRELVYGPVNGKSKLSMKENVSNHERCYQFIGCITKIGAKAISNLSIIDLKYCENLGALFLSV